MARGSLINEKKQRSEMSGYKGQLAGIQPRMRLDLPPGGFLRPDGIPAGDSSAGSVSSCCPEPA